MQLFSPIAIIRAKQLKGNRKRLLNFCVIQKLLYDMGSKIYWNPRLMGGNYYLFMNPGQAADGL